MEKFEITLTYDEIRKKPEESWKSFVKRKSTENALEYLNFNQGSKSHKSEALMMAPFLSSENNEFSNLFINFLQRSLFFHMFFCHLGGSPKIIISGKGLVLAESIAPKGAILFLREQPFADFCFGLNEKCIQMVGQLLGTFCPGSSVQSDETNYSIYFW